MARASLSDIERFLRFDRIAIAGVSRDEKDFSSQLFRDMLKRRIDVVPVNPNAESIGGARCFARIPDVDPPPAGVIVLTPNKQVESVVQDCLDAGVLTVWFRRNEAPAYIQPETMQRIRENEVTIIAGECPFMFLPDTELPHRIHGVINKLIGAYPK